MYLRPRGLRSIALTWSHSVLAYRSGCGAARASPSKVPLPVRSAARSAECERSSRVVSSKRQESAVLTALRECAGALTDLAEEAAPVLAQELRESGPPIEAKETACGEPVAPVGCDKEVNKEFVEVKKEDHADQQVVKEPLETVPTPVEAKEDKKVETEEKPKISSTYNWVFSILEPGLGNGGGSTRLLWLKVALGQ